jgi:hypothetical protein
MFMQNHINPFEGKFYMDSTEEATIWAEHAPADHWVQSSFGVVVTDPHFF